MCTDDIGVKKSKKSLHYKGSSLHYVILGFKYQGGDFSAREFPRDKVMLESWWEALVKNFSGTKSHLHPSHCCRDVVVENFHVEGLLMNGELLDCGEDEIFYEFEGLCGSLQS